MVGGSELPTNVGGCSELPTDPSSLQGEGSIDLDITLSPEANRLLGEEIERLRRTSFVCRFLAGRPNRGMVRDMLQVAVMENMPSIKSVRGLGKNFFHIELGDDSLAQPLVELKVLELKYGKVLLQPWSPGFDPSEELRKLNNPRVITATFPGLPPHLCHLLPFFGEQIGTLFPQKMSMADTIAEVPKVRILVPSLHGLPTRIRLYSEELGLTVVKVVYEGLPGQCFICKQKGHLAKNCPRKIGKGSSGPQDSRKTASTKGDEAPWQPVKKKGKPRSLGAASPPSQGLPLDRSPTTVPPASADEQPSKWVKILSGSAEAHDLKVRATNRFTLLQGLGEDNPEALAATLSPCDSWSLPPHDPQLLFPSPMELQPHRVLSTPEEMLAKASPMMERECGGDLRLLKSWIRTGKIKVKGKGSIGKPSTGLGRTIWDKGMQVGQPLRSQNVSRELFEAGRDQQAENPLGALQPSQEPIAPEIGVSLPHDMGVSPDMGVNLTVFG